MTRLEDAGHEPFMAEAIEQAQAALARGDRPIGAVIVHDGKVIARACNGTITRGSHLVHAELEALLGCGAYLREHGRQCTIYTTVEPCVMCIGAIVLANIRRIVFGMADNHMNARSIVEHNPYVRARIDLYQGGVLEDLCTELMCRYSEDETRLCLTGRRRGH